MKCLGTLLHRPQGKVKGKSYKLFGAEIPYTSCDVSMILFAELCCLLIEYSGLFQSNDSLLLFCAHLFVYWIAYCAMVSFGSFHEFVFMYEILRCSKF